jgi:isopentenyl-diphosphate Delta-isomerase
MIAAPDRAEHVVLVDADDRPIGSAEKLRAHREGLLHRAFSVFVMNRTGAMLLQRRAADKYHSGGLWSNTCCSHPRPGEPIAAAAGRRLREEMGFTCALRPVHRFVYRAELDGGMIEHECDTVLVGHYDGVPSPDPAEVGGWRWTHPDAIARELAAAPERFTAWFRIAWCLVRPLHGDPLRNTLAAPKPTEPVCTSSASTQQPAWSSSVSIRTTPTP